MSYATTKWVSEQLMKLGLKLNTQRMYTQPAYNITKHGVLPIVAAEPRSLNDQSPAGQVLLDRIVGGALGSKVSVPASPYVWNDGVSIPENRCIILEGDTPGWRSGGGKGSTLLRLDDPSAGAIADYQGAMVALMGSDSGDTQRAIGGIRHMQLDGGYSAGVVDGIGVLVQRGQEATLEDVRFYNFPKTALQVNQSFNADWRKLRVTHSGDEASDSAAVHIGGAGAPGNTDGTITQDIYGLQMEQNRGVDLRITGNPVGTGHPSTEINIFGGKCEGGLGVTAPYHHLEFAELVSIVGHRIFAHRSVPAILSEHLVTGPGEMRGVRYVGGEIELGAGITPPDYFVEILGGSVSFTGMTFKGVPNIAYVHVGASALSGAFHWGGGNRLMDLDGTTPSKPLLKDDR